MPEPASLQRNVFAAQSQQTLRVRKYFLLLWRAARCVEGVLPVAGPATGEVVAIIRILAALHADFVAVIKFRNSAQRKQQCKRKFFFFKRIACNGGDARKVMIVKKSDQILRVWIQRVLSQDVRYFRGRRIA